MAQLYGEVEGTHNVNAIKNFLSYVEISTKIASVFPFLVGAGFVMYRYGSLRPKQTLVFFFSMLLFDMTTTALNNHVGHRQTGRVPHYRASISVAIFLTMGLCALALGIYLVSITSIVILLAGMFCFGVGVLYNYGPLPIARTPFGELVSGTVMGIFIPFIAVEITRSMIGIAFPEFSRLVISVDWLNAGALGLAVMPLICCIANIMLANNICDMQEDVSVHRYTLPFYIGLKKSLWLYKRIYATAYVFIIIASVLGIVPIFSVITLLTIIPVRKNIRRFNDIQDKRQTFITAVKNFLIILTPYTACIWLGALMRSLTANA